VIVSIYSIYSIHASYLLLTEYIRNAYMADTIFKLIGYTNTLLYPDDLNEVLVNKLATISSINLLEMFF